MTEMNFETIEQLKAHFETEGLKTDRIIIEQRWRDGHMVVSLVDFGDVVFEREFEVSPGTDEPLRSAAVVRADRFIIQAREALWS